jgi:hypothetical protein
VTPSMLTVRASPSISRSTSTRYAVCTTRPPDRSSPQNRRVAQSFDPSQHTCSLTIFGASARSACRAARRMTDPKFAR